MFRQYSAIEWQTYYKTYLCKLYLNRSFKAKKKHNAIKTIDEKDKNDVNFEVENYSLKN